MAWETFRGQETRAREWTADEDRVVLAAPFPDDELARRLLTRRTAHAIAVRRSRLRGGK